MKKKIFIQLAGLLFASITVLGQQYNQGYLDSLIESKTESLVSKGSKFSLVGYTGIAMKLSKEETSFQNLVFDPILLWKPDEKIAVEAELETELEGSETAIELGYADVSYFLNKYITFRAGKFLSPFGIFQDRLHPGWINKLPTIPVGTGEDEFGIGPTSEIGIDFRGGIPLGSAKMNYSIYVSNGAQLITDPAQPEKQGTLTYGNIDANNNKKTIGGRIGLLPFSNSSLEIGASFRTGKVGDKNTVYENIGAQQYALDLTYINQLSFIKGTFDVKSQWNFEKIDNAGYIDSTDNSAYTFDNKRNSVFAQVAYRPDMFRKKFLKKLEFVFRYAELNPPSDSKAPDRIRQYTYGIDYWSDWRTVFKAAYQSQQNNYAFFLQVAVGF